MCEVNGWTVVDFYVDNDRSASSGHRPDWDRLLADIRAGRIDAVVVWNQDRGWRRMSDLEELRPMFAEFGVKLATTNIGIIDFTNPDDIFRAQVSTALSEMEIAKMKVRQRRAARQRAEKGIPKWRQAFGYQAYTGLKEADTGERLLDPVTAPLVKQAYATVLAGGSISDIARDWNAAGAYGMNGKPWSPSTVSLFLRAPRNAGLRSHTDTATGRTEIVGLGTWAGLVDEDTWRAAQGVLNAPGRAPGRKSVRKHLLTGVLRCGKPGCGGHLSGAWVMQPTGGKSGRPKAGEAKQPSGQVAHLITYACKSCRGVSVRADHVEPLVYDIVSERLAQPDALDLLKTELHDGVEAEQLRGKRQILLARLDEIANERADGLIDGRGYRVMTDRINSELAAIEARQQDQERLRVFHGLPLGTPEVAEKLKLLSPDRLRAVIDVLVDFTVMPVGKGGRTFTPSRVRVSWR